MTPEGALMRRILLATTAEAVLFRNNRGKAWMGRVIRHDERAGIITLADPRFVEFGLTSGASDLIGWRTVTVTPDMVGQQLAIFCAVEVKGPNARTTADQARFVDNVTKAGGRAGIVKTETHALDVLRGSR